MTITKAILLHPTDNVLVCVQPIEAGETILIDGDAFVMTEAVKVGHKIARVDLASADKVMKYGAPIGSMRELIKKGGHVHMHNMKSDYIPSHTRNAAQNPNQGA